MSLAEFLNKSQDGNPHLSASSVSLHMRCPRQWQQSYIFGEKGDKSDALVIGSGVHLAMSRLLKGEDMGDWWEEALEDYVPEDPRSQGVAEAMVYHYWEQMGKHLLPQIVDTEIEFLVNVPGVEIPVLGYIDIETTSTLIDLKTTRYFSRKGVRPNKEWRFQQGIYQLVVPKPSEVHVLTRSKSDPVVIPDDVSSPLHFGRINGEQIQRIVRDEWRRMNWHWETYGLKDWPGNPMHEWAGKYCGVENCCKL